MDFAIPVAAAAFIIFFGFFIALSNATSSNFSCMQSERQALLSFKHDLHDPDLRLASWVGDDCCNWSGIVCSKLTAHVHKLILGDPDGQFYTRLSGEINPSLVDLKRLRYLDLSSSDIGGARIPEFLGSLWSLRYLNLAGTKFSGMIPHQLGNLTKLHSLDLRNIHRELNGTTIDAYAKNLQWLSQLSSLRYLDMSFLDLEAASDWLEVTNSLPSLEVLLLSPCNLNFNFHPIYHVNFSSLSLLDLSYNYLGNNIPLWVSSLRSLTSLYLSGIANGGSIPEDIQNLTSLVHLDLSENYFNTSIPSWLYSLSHLEVLNLRFNQLTGTISSEIKNMTSVITLDLSHNELQGDLPTSSMAQLCKLKEIDLSANPWNRSISQILDSCSGCLSNSLQVLTLTDGQIYGHLTNKIGQFKTLTVLDLSNNSISGPIPASLGNLSSLRAVYLADNLIIETLPESLGQLVNLEDLDISDNQMEGIVSEAHFANTTGLGSFLASDNPLTLNVGQDWVPPFQLNSIHLGSWHLGPRFPLWVRSQKKLKVLGFSNTSLADVLPPWVFNFSSELLYLDLSHNQMHGRIPNLTNMGTQEYSEIDLRQNLFEGPLPLVSSKVYILDLSDNLLSGSISQFLCSSPSEPMNMASLDLAKNQLSGKLPNCWSKWKNIQLLYLNYNSFGGGIPSSFSSLIFLQSLHLRSNNLSGILSLSSLHNCIDFVTLDLSWNKFGGNIPTWLGISPSNLRILSAGFNEFQGHIPDELCALNSLQILDLSNNNLSGYIPKCFNNFFTMATQKDDIDGFMYQTDNVSIGYFEEVAFLMMKGKPVEYSKILRLVNTIDLSNNLLSGHIPLEITSLSNLLSLNLSNNFLEGEIPTKIGDMDALESIDFSVNRLSGEVPQSMSSLSFLSYLNLSYNNLSGKIPTGTQLQSFNSSSFIGNNLCGPPLTPNCSTGGETSTIENKKKKENNHEMSWFYIGMAFGFIVGFWGVCGSLIFNRTWRHTYFRFLDCIKDQIYVASVLKLRWFRETITSCYNGQ